MKRQNMGWMVKREGKRKKVAGLIPFGSEFDPFSK